MFSIVTRSGAIWWSKEMEKGSKGRTKFTSGILLLGGDSGRMF